MQIMFSRIVKSTFLNTSIRNLSTKLENEFRFCTLEDSRALLRLSGRDVKSFLQGLITNDIDHLGDKVGSSIYAALLNPRGRVAHDLIVYRDQESKSGIDVFVLDCDRQSIDRCIKTFKKYIMRSNVKMEDISMTHRVSCVIGTDQIEEMTHCLDPRLSSLGLRFISHKDHTKEMEMRYRVVDPAEYKSWRVQHGVAEGQGEIPNDALPLEYNMDALNGISFSKGCYIGQELTARTHFQGVIRKRLMPGYLSEAQNYVQIGTEVRLQPEDKTVGQVRAVVEDHVLMILRVQAAVDAELVQSRQLTVEGKEVTPLFPLWWPKEWRQSIS